MIKIETGYYDGNQEAGIEGRPMFESKEDLTKFLDAWWVQRQHTDFINEINADLSQAQANYTKRDLKC